MEQTLPSFIGTAQHFRWLRGLVSTILVLNGVDAVLTTLWLSAGAATEANPFMAVMLAWGFVPFVAGKMTLVSLGCCLLWRRRGHWLAVVGVVGLFVVYYTILLHHLGGISWMALGH